MIIFSGDEAEVEPETGISYLPGIIWPLPREYWLDGGRLMVREWDGAPFKKGPSQFRNGTEVKPGNVKLRYQEIAPVVRDWLLLHPLRSGRH